MKDTELKLISELMKDSRRSDRELGKEVGVSQPTVSRLIKRLEENGVIKEYAMIPDVRKLGIKIVAFTFGVWKPEMFKDQLEGERIGKAMGFILGHPSVVFASSGRGLGMERMFVTAHKDYTAYANFMRQARSEWAGLLTNLESFVISLEADAAPMLFSLRNLSEYVKKIE